VLFGGRDRGLNPLDDMWQWDGTAWTRLGPVDRTSPWPPARSEAAMSYDAARGRLVLFGGYSTTDLTDTWEWDGTSWVEVESLSGSPPARGRAITYDPVRRRVVVFGGQTAGGDAADAWEWQGDRWTRIVTGGAAPPVRWASAIAYDAVAASVVAFGGSHGGDLLGDTWSLRYERADGQSEACRYGFDTDGDRRTGCQDPDCWASCTPMCPPDTSCDAAAPRCGDGACNPSLETSRLCPADCDAGRVVCGDFLCDPGETYLDCPSDCVSPDP